MAKTAPLIDGPIRVRATRDGFAFGHRVRAGMRFTLPDISHFTDRWMVRVSSDEPDDLAAKIVPTRKKITDSGTRTKSGTIVTVGQRPTEADRARPTGSQSVI